MHALIKFDVTKDMRLTPKCNRMLLLLLLFTKVGHGNLAMDWRGACPSEDGCYYGLQKPK